MPTSCRARPIIAKSLKDLSCNFPVCGVSTKPAFSPSFNRFISVLINSCFVPSYKCNYRKTWSVIMENNLLDNSFFLNTLLLLLYTKYDKSVLKCSVCLHFIMSATHCHLLEPWALLNVSALNWQRVSKISSTFSENEVTWTEKKVFFNLRSSELLMFPFLVSHAAFSVKWIVFMQRSVRVLCMCTKDPSAVIQLWEH